MLSTKITIVQNLVKDSQSLGLEKKPLSFQKFDNLIEIEEDSLVEDRRVFLKAFVP